MKAASHDRFPAAWLLPALLPVLLFTLYPVADALYTSLHQVIVIFPVQPFVGLENYRQVVRSPDFRESFVNTVAFAAVTTPLILIIAYGTARLLLAEFCGRGVVRALVILPWVLPGAISAVVWLWIFHPSWGLLNLLLYETGVISRYIPWLTHPPLARLSVIVAFVWTQFPFASILLMAALSAIERALYEAAQVDGATLWQRFRYITFPTIKPVLVVVAVYQSLVALTSYDLVYALTAGGPGTATSLLSFQIWKESFSMMNFGTGSAVGFILVALSLLFMLAIIKALPAAIVPRRERA
jgi:ABC-type sugar transport system permease subunit